MVKEATVKVNFQMISATDLISSATFSEFSIDQSNSRVRMHNSPVKQLRPFNTQEVKLLLLENVNSYAVEMLKKEGYQVEFHAKALPEEILKEKIQDVHAIGIRYGNIDEY